MTAASYTKLMAVTTVGNRNLMMSTASNSSEVFPTLRMSCCLLPSLGVFPTGDKRGATAAVGVLAPFAATVVVVRALRYCF